MYLSTINFLILYHLELNTETSSLLFITIMLSNTVTDFPIDPAQIIETERYILVATLAVSWLMPASANTSIGHGLVDY